MICYIAGKFEAGNSLNLALTAVVGQHSRVTVHCYPLTSKNVAMLPAHWFWRESVSLWAVTWPRSNEWERALSGKISSCLPIIRRARMGSESIAHDVVLFWENSTAITRIITCSLPGITMWHRFYPINPKLMLATYTPSMRTDSLEIRIKGSSCPPQQ